MGGKEIATVPLENGTAKIPLDLTPGEHTIEATYTGDDKYTPATQTKEITKEKQTTTIKTENTEIKEGETVTLTGSIDSYTTGTSTSSLETPINVKAPVVLKTNLGEIEGVLEHGKFSTEYTVPAGLKYITLSVDDATEVIYVDTIKTSIEISDYTVKKGQRLNLDVKVISADGTVVDTGYLEVYIDDVLVDTVDVEDGIIDRIILFACDPNLMYLESTIS